MGSLLSTSSSPSAQSEQGWVTFPPKSGVLFAGHFYLGGEKFGSVARESFIFGEPAELQFVNSRPLTYPLPVGRPTSQSRPLRATVNLRKETARFVKADSGSEPLPHQAFHVELVLDCLVDCEVSLWLFVYQTFNGQRLVLEPQHPLFPSPERRRFSRGLGWVFSCTELTLRPSIFDEAADSSWQEAFHLAVLVEAVEDSGQAPANQQLLLCSAERLSADSPYSLKVLKQIMVIDGLPLVAHDIYGISDREAGGGNGGSTSQATTAAAAVDSMADAGDADCVVCMVKARDTVILPCRHLCLCDTCADSLRYQASCCPICRAPFRALLQLTVQSDSSGPDSSLPAAAVPILEFVDAQRQSVMATASASASGSAAQVTNRRPGTATAPQAWASPVKQPLPESPKAAQAAPDPTARPKGRPRSSSSSSGGAAFDTQAVGEVNDEDDCWADSESDEPSTAAAASGDQAVAKSAAGRVVFPEAEADLGAAALPAVALLVDGDADRGSNSCSSSTESANSQQRLLLTAVAPSASASDCGANTASAIVIAGSGDFRLQDSDESDFS